MIKASNAQFALEGTMSEIRTELLFVMHTLAQSADKDPRGPDYEEVLEQFQHDLEMLKHNVQETELDLAEKEDLGFLKAIEREKKRNVSNPNFMWVDEMRHDCFVPQNKFKMKDFILDPRHKGKDFK